MACDTSTDSGGRFWQWLLSTALAGQERTRESIADKYKWNLGGPLPVRRRLARREGRAGADACGRPRRLPARSGSRPSQLAKALAAQAAQEKTLARLFAYANLAADQDTRVSTYQGMSDEMTQVAAQFGAAWAFCRAGAADARSEDARVVDRRHAGAEALRVRPARRAAPQGAHAERARGGAAGADAADGRPAPARRPSIFLNADLPWPTVKQASGTEVRLDAAGFSAARAVGRPRRPPQGDGSLLRRPGQLSPHASAAR